MGTNTLITSYVRMLLLAFAAAPAFAILYVHRFLDPGLIYDDHAFHIAAITISTLAGVFVTYVAWACYASTGEPFLRWLTLGLLGFTVIYALHGAFTPHAGDNLWLFILYGPASRFVMAACLLAGLLAYGKPAEPPAQRRRPGYWGGWIVLFMAVNAGVAWLAHTPLAGAPVVRLSMELGAIGLLAGCVALLIRRRIRSPLMIVFAVSLAWFAESSVAFILGAPWNHQWWLAHVIFASGFLLLSYGVAQAFLTTRSFADVYTQAELFEQLTREKLRAERALLDLQSANERLAWLAATDPLTGVANYREVVRRGERELERAAHEGLPMSVLILDLDRFKNVNDTYGHQAGDAVLKGFVGRVQSVLRPGDTLGRVGGEEFVVLLPGASGDTARMVAERLRGAVHRTPFELPEGTLQVTVSIGVGEAGSDGRSLEDCLRVADQRMYRAKQEGRNRVCWR